MAKGTIKTLTGRGFGFIQSESGEELFFHSNDLVGVEFNSLKEGREVEFEKGQGRDGRPQAVRVRLTETQADDDGGVEGDDGEGSGGDGSDGD